MLSVSDAKFNYVDRASYAAASSRSSFLEQVEVVELSLADIECLASFEPKGGVYRQLLEALRSQSHIDGVYPILVEH